MGRPSDYTQATADEICSRIALGESLRSICRDDAMPDAVTVRRWLVAHDEFCTQYARAREEQADTLADEMLDVARESSLDQVGAADKRLLIDTLKWRAGKLRPRVYGDKVQQDVTHSGGVAHTIRVILDD